MNKANLYTFLTYGYFLDYKPKLKIDLSKIDKSRYNSFIESELIKQGVSIFRKAIAEDFVENQEHVVPLSGGLDSRAILSFLKEFTPLKNVHTYTFGTPGAYDYEIGNLIAKELGTKHTSFSLTEHVYTLEEEIEVSKQIDHQTYLFHHPPLFEIMEKYGDMTFWSGYIGDWIAGKHFPKNKIENSDDAIKKYSQKRVMGKSFNSQKHFIAKNHFDFKKENTIDNISYEEQLEAQNFLVKCTAPHILYNTLNFKTPHINQRWIDFMMSMPDQFRQGEYLFKRIIYEYDKKIFDLPVKGNYGLNLYPNKKLLVLKGLYNKARFYSNKILGYPPSKMINYIDFRDGIRKRKDLRELVCSSVMDLKERGILKEINVDHYWNSHQQGAKDYSKELILLSSLEIHLKAGKKI